MNIRFEWNDEKRKSNIRKHGIDFVDAAKIIEGAILTMEDNRFDYGETRYISLGLLEGRVIVVAHTESDDVIGIISARKATKYEEAIYFDQVGD